MTAPDIVSIVVQRNTRWAITAEVKPGSVPDRPMSYCRSGNSYRPGIVRMAFEAWTEDSTIAAITDGTTGHPDFLLTSLSITGKRLLRSGNPGRSDHTEPFYGNAADAPPWAQELVTGTLAALNGKKAAG